MPVFYFGNILQLKMFLFKYFQKFEVNIHLDLEVLKCAFLLFQETQAVIGKLKTARILLRNRVQTEKVLNIA